MMKKLLVILLLTVFVGGTAAPILHNVLGFGPVTAYAGPKKSQVEDDQGEDNDDQGEDEQ